MPKQNSLHELDVDPEPPPVLQLSINFIRSYDDQPSIDEVEQQGEQIPMHEKSKHVTWRILLIKLPSFGFRCSPIHLTTWQNCTSCVKDHVDGRYLLRYILKY